MADIAIALVFFLLPIAAVVFAIIAIKAKKKAQKDSLAIKDKYKNIIDIDQSLEERRLELAELVKRKNEIDLECERLKTSKNTLQDDYDKEVKELEEQKEKIKETISVFESDLDIIEFGIYKPVYDFSRSEEYRTKQAQVIDSEKALIKSENAATCSTTFTMNGSTSLGGKMIRTYQKLILRAFNGEADSLIAKVKWNNVEQVKVRLEKAKDTLNKLGESFSVQITNEYYNLKLQELILEHEYNLKKQQEKDAQRAAQEALREEEKARKEFERAQQDAEKEEAMYNKALAKVKAEFEAASEEQKAILQAQIDKLESELNEAQLRKEKALSMAQQTKRGNVYVISNIGSFGEDVYKIGMTRRLEPTDRVRELGDASVPFPFDIHAMIFSENAPELETKLHQKFSNKKVNMINPRREFFNVTLKEIESVIKDNNIEAEFIEVPEAEEYRETKAILAKIKEQEENTL